MIVAQCNAAVCIVGVALPGVKALFIDPPLDRIVGVALAETIHSDRLLAVLRSDRPVFAVRIQVDEIPLIAHDMLEVIEAA